MIWEKKLNFYYLLVIYLLGSIKILNLTFDAIDFFFFWVLVLNIYLFPIWHSIQKVSIWNPNVGFILYLKKYFLGGEKKFKRRLWNIILFNVE